MVVSAAKKACVLASLGLAASTACGGISTRHVGDSESGSGGDEETGGRGSGGRGAGGRGSGGVTTGVGGVGADGGSFTGGGIGGAGGDYGGGVGATGGSFDTGFGGVGVGGTVGGVGAIGGVGASGGAGAIGGVGATGGSSVGGSMPVAGAPATPYALPWDFSGYIAPERNVFGVEGSFYFSTDCNSAAAVNLPCTVPDMNLLGPDGQYGWAVSDVVACARGTGAQVVANPMTGVEAYAEQWGALLGIALWDRKHGDVLDALSLDIEGFTFDLIGVAPADLRVNVVTPETIGESHFVSTFVPSRSVTVYFSEALQGAWVTSPRPLDTSRISSLEFHVYTNTSAPKPFDFCVSNLRAAPPPPLR